MKVVIDDKIPFIREAIRTIASEVVYAPGHSFTPELVHDADALIVRTRTRCDEALLAGSRVRFIATATIGFDHIDTDYCRRAGIAWTNAPGCNSSSVEQYVQSVLLLWEREKQKPLRNLCLGVVGVGHVGTKVARMAGELGMQVLLCDPPRAEQEPQAGFLPISELATRCDVLSFHVPLVREDTHPTYHIADEAFFASLVRKPLFINTSRGEVADTDALLHALHSGRISDAVIDVWENEPHISPLLLQEAWIATPHIAGYSADGKANATRMSLDALCRHFHIDARYRIEPPAPVPAVLQAADHADACLQMYNPHRDSRMLKAHPERFEQLRGDYPLRREHTAYRIELSSSRTASSSITRG